MKWGHFIGGLIGTGIAGLFFLGELSVMSYYSMFWRSFTWWMWFVLVFSGFWTATFIIITLYGLVAKSDQEKYYERKMKRKKRKEKNFWKKLDMKFDKLISKLFGED